MQTNFLSRFFKIFDVCESEKRLRKSAEKRSFGYAQYPEGNGV